MKKFKLLMIVLSLSLATSAVYAGKKGNRGNPEERQKQMVEKVTKKLELNDEQQGKLKDLMAAVKKKREQMKEGRKEGQAEVKTLLLAEKLDKAKLKSLFEKRHEALKSNSDEVLDKLIAFHGSLSPDQKQQAVKFLERLQKRF